MNKGIETKNRMTLSHFHDFYALQALEVSMNNRVAENPDVQFSKAFEKLQSDLETVIDRVVPNIALRTFVYLYAACLGEARHARDGMAKERFVSSVKTRDRADLFSMVEEFPPDRQNLTSLVEVFSQDWRGGYGGKAWLNIAEALLDYGKITATAWIDHVVDLEHNNGTAFSKPDGHNTIMFDVRYPGRFNMFLDYKFSYNMLEKKPYCIEYPLSPRVGNLVQRYCVIFGKTYPKWLPMSLENLSDYHVTWGKEHIVTEKKWREWIPVGKKNKPTVSWALEVAGIHGFSAKYATLDEIKRKILVVKERAYALLGQYCTPYMRKQVNAAIRKYLVEAADECKLPKVKNPYKILPLYIKSGGEQGGLVLQFKLPYQGIGEKTKYGFSITVKNSYYEKIQGDEKGPDGTDGWTSGVVRLVYGDAYVSMGVSGAGLYISNNKLEALLD